MKNTHFRPPFRTDHSFFDQFWISFMSKWKNNNWAEGFFHTNTNHHRFFRQFSLLLHWLIILRMSSPPSTLSICLSVCPLKCGGDEWMRQLLRRRLIMIWVNASMDEWCALWLLCLLHNNNNFDPCKFPTIKSTSASISIAFTVGVIKRGGGGRICRPSIPVIHLLAWLVQFALIHTCLLPTGPINNLHICIHSIHSYPPPSCSFCLSPLSAVKPHPLLLPIAIVVMSIPIGSNLLHFSFSLSASISP